MTAPEFGETVKKRYPLIAFVGTPGVGKTTLVSNFAQEVGAEILDEPYEHIPYLKDFYTSGRPWDYAFDIQMDFIAVRGNNMRKAKNILTDRPLLQDSTFDADMRMAQILREIGWIKDDDYAVYLKTCEKIQSDGFITKPDVLVALRDDYPEIENRIKINRKRDMEIEMLEMFPEYFRTLAEGFNKWFEEIRGKMPVREINVNRSGYDSSEIKSWMGYYIAKRDDLIFPDFLVPRPVRDRAPKGRVDK